MPGPRLAPPGAGRCAKTLRGRSPALNKSASKRRYLAARKTMDNSTRWGNRSTGISYTGRKTLMAAGKDPRQWPSCAHFLALTFRDLAEGLPGIPFLVGRAHEQLAFPQRRLSVLRSLSLRLSSRPVFQLRKSALFLCCSIPRRGTTWFPHCSFPPGANFILEIR